MNVLYGRDYCAANQIDYEQQFTTSRNSVVSVISHAHLPMVLNNPSNPNYQKLKDVSLIVIDEDPTSSFIYTLGAARKDPTVTANSPITRDFLQTRQSLGQAGNIEQAILRLMDRATTGAFDAEAEHVTNRRRKSTSYSLTGAAFWKALAQELDGAVPDFRHFQDSLRAAVDTDTERIPADFFAAFTEDLASPKAESARFGLTWIKAADHTIRGMQFRGDVLRRIPRDTPPIVVLDAYASRELRQYERLFPNHTVTYVEEWPFTPLDIEHTTDLDDAEDEGEVDLGIDRVNLVAGKQPQLRNYLMAETGELTRGHPAGTLMLSYRNVIKHLEDPELQARWSWRSSPPLTALPPKAVETMWWFSGRGINSFDGRHVVAWHPPHRPVTYRWHTMAALAPHSPSDRNQLARHAFQSELLQMLHRGRQTNYPVGTPDRPRVVLFFHPGELPPTWATTRPFQPQLRFSRHAKNPLHPAAVQAIAAELHALLGGVPQACLAGLELYTAKPMEKALWTSIEPELRLLLKTDPAAPVKAPVLFAWTTHPDVLQHRLGEFKAADGSTTALIAGALHSADEPALHALTKHDVKVVVAGRASTTRVFAATTSDAERALRRLLR
ncbi:hypothetical protein [Deinococcus arcticus]|uniref:hypothetical protein n=1 Tax=Deinococcus arcticus TaxID=2136176 RepID=UPI0011B1D506|nr:hypothetical protein [Deinococcus arcticus]